MRTSHSFKCQDVTAAGSLLSHKISFVELEKEKVSSRLLSNGLGVVIVEIEIHQVYFSA